MHGLTQSERLVLMVIDGATPYSTLRLKLKGLTAERFDRALTNLLKKTLAIEVLLPTGYADRDEFDSATIDNFLRQDPLDPVTIIVFDPEDELELDMQQEGAANTEGSAARVSAPKIVPVILPERATLRKPAHDSLAPQAPKLTSVDFYVPLEIVNQPAASSQGSRLSRDIQQATPSLDDLVGAAVSAGPQNKYVPWVKIILAAGICILLALLIFKFKR